MPNENDQHKTRNQSRNFSKAIMQLIVDFFGSASYFPFANVTPCFGFRILNFLGQYVVRSF